LFPYALVMWMWWLKDCLHVGKVKVKTKLSMKTYWRSGGIAARILDLVLDGGEWSASSKFKRNLCISSFNDLCWLQGSHIVDCYYYYYHHHHHYYQSSIGVDVEESGHVWRKLRKLWVRTVGLWGYIRTGDLPNTQHRDIAIVQCTKCTAFSIIGSFFLFIC
jgi:hypothetical protein